MNRNTYLQIIVDTFFETLQPIKSEIAESLLAFRKKLFLTALIRIHKVAERDFFVCKEDFKMQMLLALDELNERVNTEGYRYSNAWSDKDVYLNADYNWERNGHSYKKDRFEEVLKLETECEEIEDLYINLSSIFPFLTGSMCGLDINFIEWVLEDFNLTTDEKNEPEPLDLSDTSAVQKIIYLNELGIIDFLRAKPEFALSTNLLATVLSAITGENLMTLQPILNPMISKTTAQKNNPYNSKKTVDKVRQTLIDKNIKPKAS